MINVTLVYVLTDKNLSNVSLFDELDRFYKTFEVLADKFELVIINSCHNECFNSDLNIFCANRNYCRLKYSYSVSLSKCIKYAINMASYENIILLNNDIDSHPIDFDYIMINYTAMKDNSCFALFENNNSNQEDILGVVVKSYDLRQILNYINTRSMTEFLLQLCMLYYYIGRSFRINNRLSHFMLYQSTIVVKGLMKLRLILFLMNCKKVYPNKFNNMILGIRDNSPLD